MSNRFLRCLTMCAGFAAAALASPGWADDFHFSTGNPDGLIATSSGSGTETADDFVLSQETVLTNGTFTGLLPANADATNIASVSVEIYRLFPLDSTDPPSGQVPTRLNSPADEALASRDSSLGQLAFTTLTMNSSFAAANSVITGINPVPNTFTGGEGAVSGQEVEFSFTLANGIDLDAGHYFFVPQVQLLDGTFLWLSAPRPIVSPGTPFPLNSTDLQSWIRDGDLAPDWLRVGTDITHTGPFNAAFSLDGIGVPEPSSWMMMLTGFAALGLALRQRSGGRQRHA